MSKEQQQFPRLRVLVSAYACEPDKGSEPGAGWSWVRALAQRHEVVVITRANNRPAVERAREKLGGPNVEFVWIDLASWLLWLKKRGLPAQVYYLLWQRKVSRVARGLHRMRPFDAVHHLTWAVDWMPAGVLSVPATIRVWGPVGGSTGAPPVTYRWLGVRGILHELTREAVTRAFRGVTAKRTAGRSSLVVLQNRDGLAWLRRFGAPFVVMPNVVVPGTPLARRPSENRNRAVFVGRLDPLKGIAIALHALARSEAAHWSLEVIGEGRDRRRLTKLVRRLGVHDRVRFLGQLPRTEALERLAQSDVLLFPSTHDAAGFVPAEAVACGVPVICLDVGGPPTIIPEDTGIAVQPSWHLPKALASALSDVDTVARPKPDDRWSEGRLVERVDSIYAAALDCSGGI